MKLIHFAVVTAIALGTAACGNKGPLFLPEKAPEDSQSTEPQTDATAVDEKAVTETTETTTQSPQVDENDTNASTESSDQIKSEQTDNSKTEQGSEAPPPPPPAKTP